MGFFKLKKTKVDKLKPEEEEVVGIRSVKTKSELMEEASRKVILNNVISFSALGEGVKVDHIIMDILYTILSQKDEKISIGIIDFNIKFPSLYKYLLKDVGDKALETLQTQALGHYVKEETLDFRDVIIDTKFEDVFLVTPDLYNETHFDYSNLEHSLYLNKLYSKIKNSFDLVIMKLPFDMYSIPDLYFGSKVDYGYWVLDNDPQSLAILNKTITFANHVMGGNFIPYRKLILESSSNITDTEFKKIKDLHIEDIYILPEMTNAMKRLYYGKKIILESGGSKAYYKGILEITNNLLHEELR